MRNTISMGFTGHFPQVCLRIQRANVSRLAAEPRIESVWWVLLFPESHREQAPGGSGGSSTPRSIQTSRPSSLLCLPSPVSEPPGNSRDRPASPLDLFPPRTSKEQAIIREKWGAGWGLSLVGRGHRATCVLGCPHEECESEGLGHQEGQTVGLSKQSRAW